MTVNEALFSLIQSGLDIEEAKLKGNISWRLLRGIALQHGVIAVVAQGLSNELKNGCSFDNLDERLRQQFAFDMLAVEQNYLSLWQSSKHLADLFHGNGVRTIELKGFVTSRLYPNPCQRSFCDFDCYLNDFEKGNEIIAKEGIKLSGSYKHVTFNYESSHVENHQFCTHFRGDKKASQFELLLQEIMLSDNADYLPDSYIEKPTPIFNALFLTYHARSHFFDERVSLKQVIDWAMFMKSYGKNVLDWEYFIKVCQDYGLLSFAQSMSRIAQKICHVDIPFDCLPNDMVDNMLLDDIFSSCQEHVEYGKGFKTRCQILRNKYKGRWKYNYFSNQSFGSALRQQIWGYLVETMPKRN